MPSTGELPPADAVGDADGQRALPGESRVVTVGNYATGSHKPSDELLVVSWNVQYGIEVERAAEALATDPELRAADIILLQEMDEVGTEEVARSIDLNFGYFAAAVHPNTGRKMGNAVLSPWPLRDHGVVALPHKSALRGQARVVVHAAVDVADLQVRACSVHTEVPTLSSAKRLRQVAGIGQAASEWEEDPLIIGGDFNTVTRRGINAVSARLESIGVRRMTDRAGPTLRRGGRDFTLDHIYARSLVGHSSGVVDGRGASDHHPIWARCTHDHQ